jgi:hypothetical protein
MKLPDNRTLHKITTPFVWIAAILLGLTVLSVPVVISIYAPWTFVVVFWVVLVLVAGAVIWILTEDLD